MDTYKLERLGNATVGMFGDFQTFGSVIDYVLATNGYQKGLEVFGFNDIQDLIESLADDSGAYDEGRAKDLVMDCLDGVDADSDPEVEYGDFECDRAMGK